MQFFSVGETSENAESSPDPEAGNTVSDNMIVEKNNCIFFVEKLPFFTC